MPAPSVNDVKAYLGLDHSWADPDIESALAAEKAAQARVCRVPGDADTWPADLTEALFRRVAHNLAVRALPLGLEATISEMSVTTNRVGGTDAEVRRLETPWRRLVIA